MSAIKFSTIKTKNVHTKASSNLAALQDETPEVITSHKVGEEGLGGRIVSECLANITNRLESNGMNLAIKFTSAGITCYYGIS